MAAARPEGAGSKWWVAGNLPFRKSANAQQWTAVYCSELHIPFHFICGAIGNAPKRKASHRWAWIELVTCCAASDERNYQAAKQPV
jgi:hypothetical protein